MKANLNDTVIRYEELGTGPAILVLHDAPSNRDILRHFVPLAEAGYRIVVTHLEGGTSKGSDPELRLCSRSAVALLNFLGIGRAVVFGIGRGGSVLLDLMDHTPDRVAASTLVVGPEAAGRIRRLSERPDFGAALREGLLSEVRDELLAILSSEKEKTALSPLFRLGSWIESVRSRNLYCSAIHHRSALLTGLDVPPLIEETDGEGGRSPVRRASRAASRGWRKLRGMNAHLAALVHSLFPPDEELDEEDVLSDLP